MNNIFQKNILALNLKNKKLALKLQSYVPTEVPQVVSENNAYNLIYKGKYIHNKLNPLGEAKEVFSMATNEPVAIHLVYGLGLGYLFQVTCLNSNGTVILYEPDLNIIWLAFSFVDFSNDILKKNVYFTDQFEDVSQAIYEHSGMTNTPQMLSVPSIREFDKAGFDELVLRLQELVGAYALDLKYTKENFYPALKMLIKNVPNLFNELPLARFSGALTGKTAVVVSAGPSLDKNIELLKKHREKFVLFTVGTAVKTLYKNGIKPDFLCIIETYNSSKQVEGLDLNDVYFITEPYSNPALRNKEYKRVFSHISANSPINLLWSELCGEKVEEYWSKGTVSYTAINCARILGCSKIILVGQDLAYIEGQCYSKDSAYKDLVCEKNKDTGKWEITAKNFEEFADAISAAKNPEDRAKTAKSRLKRLNSTLYYVKGINGDMIPTESVYAAFVRPLTEYAKHFNTVKYINTSLVGAQIDGYENMPFEEAIEGSEPVGNFELKTDFDYDKELIINNIKSKRNELLEALKIIEEGKSYAKNLMNDLKRKRSVDEDVLKSLKKLSLNYLSLSGDFADKSKMFDFLTAADKIDLDYEMKMMREFNFDSVSRICEKIAGYYNNAEKRIPEIEGLINESISTAS